MTATVRSLKVTPGSMERLQKFFKFTAPVLLALMIEGCITITYGVMPQTDRLDELSIGESRQGDVLLILGQPRGKGAANVSPEFDRRAIWFYEYVESDGKDIQLKMLLVYFVGDVYDGYLWFNSAGEIS